MTEPADRQRALDMAARLTAAPDGVPAIMGGDRPLERPEHLAFTIGASRTGGDARVVVGQCTLCCQNGRAIHLYSGAAGGSVSQWLGAVRTPEVWAARQGLPPADSISTAGHVGQWQTA